MERLGVILNPTAPASTASPSVTSDNRLCPICGKRKRYWREETYPLQEICALCHRSLTRKGKPIPPSIIPERYESARLEHLPEAVQKAYRTLKDEEGIMLWGPAGTGKTYAMCAFAKELWQSGYELHRTSYDLLMLKIRDTYKPKAERTEYQVIKDLVDADKLIIEDLGTTVATENQESDFSLRTLLIVLDQRLERCRATYVTSNKNIEEIRNSFDSRIASRLTQACQVVQLTGKDKRSNPT